MPTAGSGPGAPSRCGSRQVWRTGRISSWPARARPGPAAGRLGTCFLRSCSFRIRSSSARATTWIAAGGEDGTHIQLAGEGETGPGGGPAGDLFLEIVQLPHPIFERQGDDLHCTVTIPMVAAALGTTLTVQTLDGPAAVDIRPGTQSGQAIPL